MAYALGYAGGYADEEVVEPPVGGGGGGRGSWAPGMVLAPTDRPRLLRDEGRATVRLTVRVSASGMQVGRATRNLTVEAEARPGNGAARTASRLQAAVYDPRLEDRIALEMVAVFILAEEEYGRAETQRRAAYMASKEGVRSGSDLFN